MALQVWLPLNKNNLNNVGLAENIEITSTNTEFKGDVVSPLENGARLFKSNNSNLQLPSDNTLIKNKPEISVSFWCYQTIATGQTLFTFMKSYFDFSLYNNKLYVRTNGTGGDISGNALQLTLPQQTINEWHHYAFTFNRGLIKCYIDGNFSNSGNTTENDTMFSGMTKYYIGGYSSTYKFSGYTCDFRIYDNAINEDDVKRICKQKLFELVPYSGAKDVLFDRSGLMNMPLVNNGAEFNTNYLYFDGTNDQLRPKVTNDGFNISGGTLSIWFAPTEKPNKNRLIYTDEKSHMAIGFSSTGNSLALRCGTSNGNTNCLSTTGISWGSLNNVIVTYNDTMPDLCLINGTIPSVYTTSTGFTETKGKGLTIGGRQHNTTSRFDGKIYKVAVYNRQFTQDEAVKLYNSERGMFLPDDYIQLEYIEGTGEQWIDSGVKANQDTVAEIEFEITGNGTGYNAIFGARTSSTSNCFLAWSKCGNGKIGVQIGNSGSKNCNTSQALNVVYKLKVSNGNITVNGDSANFTPVSDFETPLNVRIFNIANGNTSSSGTGNRILIGKVYSFKLYESDIIIRNMIPSKRKSDNVIGMYDMVSRQFFTNSGTGSFTGA